MNSTSAVAADLDSTESTAAGILGSLSSATPAALPYSSAATTHINGGGGGGGSGGPGASPPSSSSAPSPRRRSVSDRRAKRQKVSRACDACKLRKSKCSGTIPCSACVARDMQCLWDSRHARGRPQPPLPAPESQLGETLRPYSGTGVAADRPVSRARSSVAAVDHPVVEDAGPPEPTPLPSRASPELGIAEVEGQYVDPTSGLAFLHRAWRRLSGGHNPHHRPETASPLDHAQAVGGGLQKQVCAGDKPFDKLDSPSVTPSVPDYEASQELLAFYFDICIVTYRFLHRGTVEGWLARLQQNMTNNLPLSHGLGETRASVVLTVLAIALFHKGKVKGSLSMEESAEAIRRGDRLFTVAARLADAATGFPTLESVQAKLVHTLYLLHSSRMNQAWYVFGEAIQLIAAQGLHRKTTRAQSIASRSSGSDYINAQCRRRVFWVAYTLDTYMGVVLGRPRHYHDDSIDQEFPDAVNDEDMTPDGPKVLRKRQDCTSEALICNAKIAQLVAKTSNQIYAIKPPPSRQLLELVDCIQQELLQWKESLPPILGSVQPSSLIPPFRRQATALKLTYCHAVMHVNRPFLLRSTRPRDRQQRTYSKGVSDCLAAARDVLLTVDEMALDGCGWHAFWWTHYVTFCSLTVVYVWAIQNNASGSANDMASADLDRAELFELAEKCQYHLGNATASSSPSRRYSIILEELRQEAIGRPRGPVVGAYTNGLDAQGGDVAGAAAAANFGQNGHGLHSDDVDAMGSHHDTGSSLPDSFLEFSGMRDGWQTTDWLDIDSLAFGPFPNFGFSPQSWAPPPPGGEFIQPNMPDSQL